MSTEPVPRRRMFKAATIMCGLWIGANTLLVMKAYAIETGRKQRVETTFSIADAAFKTHLDKELML